MSEVIPEQAVPTMQEQQYLQNVHIQNVGASSGGYFFFGSGDNGIGLLQMTAARMSFSSNNTYVIYDSLCVQVYYHRFVVVFGQSALYDVSTHTHQRQLFSAMERREKCCLVIGCHFSVETHIEITQYILPLENVETMCWRCGLLRKLYYLIIIKVTLHKLRKRSAIIRSPFTLPYTLYGTVVAATAATCRHKSVMKCRSSELSLSSSTSARR